jgi:hypothetical protein
MNADSELDRLLAIWGAQHRLSDAQAADVRSNIVGEPRQSLDAEWLWSLLRPVTDLLQRIEEPAEAGRALRHVPDNWTPYLRLA